MSNTKEFTNWDIQKLTELERLGHYNNNTFEILQFIKLDQWQYDKKTKREQFEATIKHIEYNVKEYKKQEKIRIIFNRKVFTSLTKVPNPLINELVKDKMIIKSDKKDYFELNTKIVYCRICAKNNIEQNYIYKKNEYDTRQELREYEIKDHLINWHYFYKTEYSIDYKKSWRISTLSEKDIVENISYSKPQYQFKDHHFEVIQLQTNGDRLNIKVKCTDCGYEPYIRTENLSKMCELGSTN